MPIEQLEQPRLFLLDPVFPRTYTRSGLRAADELACRTLDALGAPGLRML
jgi:hypothetical protein